MGVECGRPDLRQGITHTHPVCVGLSIGLVEPRGFRLGQTSMHTPDDGPCFEWFSAT